MRALLMDDIFKQKLAKIKAYAEAHPFTIIDIADMLQGNKPPPGANPYHVALLEVGYCAVYSIEENRDGATYRHLSVSVRGGKLGALPNHEACNEIMKELGFENSLFLDRTGKDPQLYIHLEEKGTVNILEKITK